MNEEKTANVAKVSDHSHIFFWNSSLVEDELYKLLVWDERDKNQRGGFDYQMQVIEDQLCEVSKLDLRRATPEEIEKVIEVDRPEYFKITVDAHYINLLIGVVEKAKLIYRESTKVRLAIKIIEMVNALDEDELVEVFGRLDPDDFYDRNDEAHAAVAQAHRYLYLEMPPKD